MAPRKPSTTPSPPKRASLNGRAPGSGGSSSGGGGTPPGEDEPLLPGTQAEAGRKEGGLTLVGAAGALANTIFGAGVMALPFCFKELGIGVGAVCLALAMVVTATAAKDLVWSANFLHIHFYGELVQEVMGTFAKRIFDLSMLLNNGGLLVVYLRILGDVLVGDDRSPGLVVAIAGGHKWYTTRLVIQGGMTVVFLAPLCSLKKLESLSRVSVVCISLAMLFCSVGVVLGIVHLVMVQRGEITNGDHVRLLPDPALFHPSMFNGVFTVVTAVPVLLNAFICHYQILPLERSLQQRLKPKVMKSIWGALALVTSLYCVVSAFLFICFGEDTSDDVLLNFRADAIAELVGRKLGNGLAIALPAMYAVSLTLTFPFINFAFKELVLELAPGKGEVKYYAVTFGILAAVYVCSLTLHNIKEPLKFVGATAAVALGFIFPAGMRLKLESDFLTTKKRIRLLALLAIGAAITVITLLSMALFDLKLFGDIG